MISVTRIHHQVVLTKRLSMFAAVITTLLAGSPCSAGQQVLSRQLSDEILERAAAHLLYPDSDSTHSTNTTDLGGYILSSDVDRQTAVAMTVELAKNTENLTFKCRLVKTLVLRGIVDRLNTLLTGKWRTAAIVYDILITARPLVEDADCEVFHSIFRRDLKLKQWEAFTMNAGNRLANAAINKLQQSSGASEVDDKP